jgi:hypothetical protein
MGVIYAWLIIGGLLVVRLVYTVFKLIILVILRLPGIIGVGFGIFLIVIGHANWGVILIMLGIFANIHYIDLLD